MHETYHSELGGKDFAYDGEKSLFTVGSLPRNKLEFAVVLEDMPSNRYVRKNCKGFLPSVLVVSPFNLLALNSVGLFCV